MLSTGETSAEGKKWAVAFVGSVLPPALCERTAACSAAGNRYQTEMLNAIRQSAGVAPFVISTLPIGIFPKSRSLAVSPQAITVQDGISGVLIPQVNIAFLKQLSIVLANTLLLCLWSLRNLHRRRFVLVYNVYPANAMSVLFVRKLLGGRAIAIVPDFPHNLSFDFRGIRGMLQRVDVWMESRSLRFFDGLVPITKYIADDFAPRCPALVMEGGVSDDEASFDASTELAKVEAGVMVCLFSGTLDEVNGIRLLLDAFRLIADPGYRLWIFGRGPLEELVRSAALMDARIVYGGFVPNAEIRNRQRQATLLLNARPTDQLVARYTFPSKLFEYLLSGRPILSTALPGIPNAYREHMFVLQQESPEELASLIQDICSRPAAELAQMGVRARAFILGDRTWRCQGRRVCEFLSGV